MNPIKEFLNEVEAKVLELRTDVISLIKSDHRKVDLLFEQYIASEDRAEKDDILKSIIGDLKVHAAAEEAKVYPTLDNEDHAATNKALEEHHLIKILIEELCNRQLKDDKVDAKVKVLSEVFQLHAKEEEGKYLPELKESGADLEQLGEDFTSEKDRLMSIPAKTKKVKSAKKAPAVKPIAEKKPVAKKPVAKKPVAKKPVAVKPAAKKPVAKKPAATKPVSTKLASKKPAFAKITAASKQSKTVKMPTSKAKPKRKAS